MKVLFVSNDLTAGNLAILLKKEGHDVRLYIDEPAGRGDLMGFVQHVDDWKQELSWVGKGDGLIVFDDVGFGKEQDDLRKEGYFVFGGSKKGEQLELNRYFGQEIFRHNGVKTAPLLDFHKIEDAIEFLKENEGMWVVKQNGPEREFNYVGEFSDASDTIGILKNYKYISNYPHSTITLHKRVEGVEIGAARYFNGTDWVGPIEVSLEHKRLFPGDIGPTTSEMGTLAWYDDNEENKLFRETIALLKPFLQKANFRGDFSLNCLVNENGAFPTEATARLGCPITHLHSEIHESPWGEFLLAVAKGEQYDLKWKRGFGLVATIAVPPFPFYFKNHTISSRGIPVFIDENKTDGLKHLHFEEVALRDGSEDEYVISGDRGYALYVTAMGKTVPEAQQLLDKRIEGIHIPKMFYRNDIGSRFIAHDEQKLREWGYL